MESGDGEKRAKRSTSRRAGGPLATSGAAVRSAMRAAFIAPLGWAGERSSCGERAALAHATHMRCYLLPRSGGGAMKQAPPPARPLASRRRGAPGAGVASAGFNPSSALVYARAMSPPPRDVAARGPLPGSEDSAPYWLLARLAFQSESTAWLGPVWHRSHWIPARLGSAPFPEGGAKLLFLEF